MDRKMHESQGKGLTTIQCFGYGVTTNLYKCPSLAEQIQSMYEYCKLHPELAFDHEYDFLHGVVATRERAKMPLLQCPSMQQLVANATPNSHIIIGNRLAFPSPKDIVKSCKFFSDMGLTISLIDYPWIDTRYAVLDPSVVINDVMKLHHFKNLGTNWRDNSAPYGWRWCKHRDGPYLSPSVLERKMGGYLEGLFETLHNLSAVYTYLCKNPGHFRLCRKYRRLNYTVLASLFVAHCLDYPKIRPTELSYLNVTRRLIERDFAKKFTKEDVLRKHKEWCDARGGHEFVTDPNLRPAKYQLDEVDEDNTDKNPYF